MSILHKPLVTEKITQYNDKGIYGFIVDKRANKITIKQTVEQCYGVHVDHVNTMRYMGKRKVRYTKLGIQRGRRIDYKKAVVKLRAGEFIDFYANV